MVSTGAIFTCALFNDGTVSCWGSNRSGQLGNGTYTFSNTPVSVDLPAGTTATTITTGAFHACALLSNGTATCWGNNNFGQFGIGTTTGSNTPVPLNLPTGTTATAITAGTWHTCALLDNGTTSCWGDNRFGQLGSFIDSSNTPISVGLPAGATATAIAAGNWHTCALLDNGTTSCWGDNRFGSLGNGTFIDSSIPVTVSLPAGTTATAVTVDRWHACALLDNGTTSCWGDNRFGQLGNGSNAGSNIPVTVSLPAGTTATAITIGGDFACGLLDNGTATCWGDNNSGQLGNGTTTGSNIPVTVSLPAGTTATAIAAGGNFTCAALDNGTATCWGDNGAGQLGNDSNADSSTPVTVSFPVRPGIVVPVGGIQADTDAGEAGAIVTYTVTATAVLGAAPTVVCTPASDSFFPIGTTTVTCSATDDADVASAATFDVTVTDNEDPSIDGTNQTFDLAVGATSGPFAYIEPTATDNSGTATIVCTPAPGATFAAGETTISCAATDPTGNTATATYTIVAITAPTVPGGVLPETGGSRNLTIAIAIAFLVAGALMTITTRRGRTSGR